MNNIFDDHLKVEVIRAILNKKPELKRDVVVIALQNGCVLLRGLVPSRTDCQELEAVVKAVPNVSQVFCNIAIQTEKTVKGLSCFSSLTKSRSTIG